jgi:hypothetical protein
MMNSILKAFLLILLVFSYSWQSVRRINRTGNLKNFDNQ